MVTKEKLDEFIELYQSLAQQFRGTPHIFERHNLAVSAFTELRDRRAADLNETERAELERLRRLESLLAGAEMVIPVYWHGTGFTHGLYVWEDGKMIDDVIQTTEAMRFAEKVWGVIHLASGDSGQGEGGE